MTDDLPEWLNMNENTGGSYHDNSINVGFLPGERVEPDDSNVLDTIPKLGDEPAFMEGIDTTVKEPVVNVQTGNTDWKYLGTGCTTGVSGQIENSETKRLLWNYYNRVSTNISVIETTASWSYSTAAYRPLNNDTTNRIEIVCGVSEDAVDIDVMAVVLSDAVNPRYTGIGVNATNANTWDILIRSAGIAYSLAHTKLRTVPAVGYTYYQCLEYGSGAGTQTWYGASEAGISAMWMC